jgi:hypothetical protein
MKPTGLLVDLQDASAGVPVTDDKPRFTWILPDGPDWKVQTGYQIAVCGASESLFFDTGRVRSSSSTAVGFSAFNPQRNQSFTFKVRCWNSSGRVSEWSETAKFSITLSPMRFHVSPQDRLVVRQEAPTRIVELSKELRVYDFGRAMFGNITVSGPTGATVTIRLGELLTNGRINRKPGRNVRFHEERVTLGADGTASLRLTAKDSRRMPADIGSVMPFRYIEADGALTDHISVKRTVVTVPFNANASSFTSSDETLNRVWQLCKDTMEATSFCGVYVDGDRERLPYEADAYINMLGHYCVDRSYATARHTHELLMLEPTWPTEWILFSVLMAWQDYLHTGDIDSIERHIKTIDAKSLQALAGPDGLISTVSPPPSKAILKSIFRNEPIRDIVDWPQGERDNVELMPVSTIINAFYLAALRDLSAMYKALKQDLKASEIEREFHRVYRVFQDKCFDPVLERYTDGPGSRHTGIHANMFPLAFGLVPNQWVGKVADYIVGRGMACSVYGAQFLMDGLYRSGRACAALSLLTSRSDRSWGHMVYDVGTTMALEAWDTRYKPNQDWNHAWGAAPANLIPRWLVGVWPSSPGAETLRIAPQPAGLTFFKAKVPTIRGAVDVSFRQSGTTADMSVTLPGNTSASVVLPRPPTNRRITAVRIDDKRTKLASSYEVNGGRTTHFSWTWH